MGAIWYGLKGGVAFSVLVSILYAPVVFGSPAQAVFTSTVQRLLELALFNVVGLVTGILSERQRRESEGFRHTAEQLRRAYRKLQEQTVLIIEKEQQLRRAERLSTLGELAAEVAHEIRNPLASIKGTAEILMDASTPQQKKEEFARLMLEESDRLNSVVQDFLKLARFNKLQREEADLHEILRRMLQFIDFQAERNGVEVRTDFSEDVPRLKLDISQMEHAILNVLLNAVGAMPDGGTLSLKTRCAHHNGGKEVILEIEDTGTGIESENIPHIFEPFFTTRTEGTGLGLSIVKRIIKAHGGSIDIESEIDRFTRVTVALPLHSENEE
jgi:signal transduction histidine kinase